MVNWRFLVVPFLIAEPVECKQMEEIKDILGGLSIYLLSGYSSRHCHFFCHGSIVAIIPVWLMYASRVCDILTIGYTEIRAWNGSKKRKAGTTQAAFHKESSMSAQRYSTSTTSDVSVDTRKVTACATEQLNRSKSTPFLSGKVDTFLVA